MLRPYQEKAIAELRSCISAGSKRLLLTLPTGGGKTLTSTEIIRMALERGLRVLFVVHLRELVDQTVRALARCGVTHVGVMRGDDGRADSTAPVQIASIQTLARREKPKAELVILDEAHRSIARLYKRHIWDAYPASFVIGLTATPCRTDGRPLGEHYERLVVAATYSELIEGGYIAEPIVYAPKSAPDLSSVRRVAGDYDEGQLEGAMTAIAGDIVPTWQEHAGGHRTVVFAVSINHSRDIVERFLAAGVAAEHLDGETPAKERAAILARLASGETTVVSNCAVLTEGFDMPAIRCAVLARPTLSLVLHMQTAGRALRAGEVRPVILDHAGNVSRHGLPHEDRTWSIDGKTKREKEKQPFRMCKGCFAYIALAAKECPYCGLVVEKETRELPQEERHVKLAKVDIASLEEEFFIAALHKAQLWGLKPGFAAHKFKERFGRWPPWSWSERGKQMFAGDESWRWRVKQRGQRKAVGDE